MEFYRRLLFTDNHKESYYCFFAVIMSCCFIVGLNITNAFADESDSLLQEANSMPSVLDANFSSRPSKQNKSDQKIDTVIQNIKFGDNQSKLGQAQDSNKKDTQTLESKKQNSPSMPNSTGVDSPDKTSHSITPENKNTTKKPVISDDKVATEKTNSVVPQNTLFIKPLAEKFQTNKQHEENKSENTSTNQNILSIQPLPEEYQKSKTPAEDKKSNKISTKPTGAKGTSESEVKESPSVPRTFLGKELAEKYSTTQSSILNSAQSQVKTSKGNENLTQEKATWVKSLSDKYQINSDNAKNNSTAPTRSIQVAPVVPDSVKLHSSQTTKSVKNVNNYVDKPSKEEIQLAINSFRDDNNPLFDRYRIRSRNSVVDTTGKLYEINDKAWLFEEDTLEELYSVNHIVNIVNSKDFQMPFAKALTTITGLQFDMQSFTGIDIQINVVNYMLSKDLLQWLENLDDSLIGFAPRYDTTKDSILFSWIWGAVTIGLVLFVALIIASYYAILWYCSEEYNAVSISHIDRKKEIVMQSTAEMYSDIYTPRKSDVAPNPRKNPYDGVEIFIDRRIEE